MDHHLGAAAWNFASQEIFPSDGEPTGLKDYLLAVLVCLRSIVLRFLLNFLLGLHMDFLDIISLLGGLHVSTL